MPNRNLSTDIINTLDGAHVEFYHLLRFDFSTPVYYTTAPYDIDYGGNTYQSSDVISKVPDIKEQLKISPSTIQIEWSGATLASIATPLTNNYRNVNVYIYRYVVGADDVFLLFKGFIDSFSSDDDLKGGTSEIVWNITNHWADWEATNGRLLTDESQQALFPGDLFLQYAGVTDVVLAWWGNTTTVSQAVLRGRNTTIYGYTGTNALILGFLDYQEQNLASRYDWTAGAASEGVLPLTYGRTSMIGTPIFRDVTGISNQYLWVVYALCEGETHGLVDVLFDGVSYLDASISSYVSVTFYNGTDTQTADSALVSASSEWTSAHQGKGICYCVIKYTYNKDIWQGEPTPQFIIDGKKCLNISTGATALTENNAFIAYDYLTNTRYGKGISNDEIDYSSFIAAADYCAELLTDHDAGLGGTPVTIPRFAFNGVLSVADEIKKNVENILLACSGYLVWINGKYKIVIERDDDTSVYSLTVDNIAPRIEVKDIGIKDRANKVFYKFVDPTIDYAESTTYKALSAATITAEDNGKSLQKTISNKFENNRYRAANRCNTELKKSRDGLMVNVECKKAGSIKIETGNVVDLTWESRGWTNKLFRVRDMLLKENGDNKLSLVEYDPTNHIWAVQAEASTPTKTALTNPLSVTAPTGLTLTATSSEQITTGDEGSRISRIKITWTPSADSFVIGYEIEYKTLADTNYTQITNATSGASAEAWINNAEVGVTYNVRIRAYNGIGITSSWVLASTAPTGVISIGADKEIAGTDAFANTNFFYWRSVFEALDNFSYSGASITGTGHAQITGAAGATYLYKYVADSQVQLNTYAVINKMRCNVQVNGVSSLGTNGVQIGFGTTSKVYFKLVWNSGSGQVDIYGNKDNPTYIPYSVSDYLTSITPTAGSITVNLEIFIKSGTPHFYVNGSIYYGTTSTWSSSLTLGQLIMRLDLSSGSTGANVKIGEYQFNKLV